MSSEATSPGTATADRARIQTAISLVRRKRPCHLPEISRSISDRLNAACSFEMVNNVAEFFPSFGFPNACTRIWLLVFKVSDVMFPLLLDVSPLTREKDGETQPKALCWRNPVCRSPCRMRTPARCEQKWKRSSLPQVLGSFSPPEGP